MKSITQLLHDHPFFDGLDENTLDLIAGCSINTHFGPDEEIFSENSPADHFYVIRRGKVAVEIDASRGAPLVLETVGSGEVLGVSWVLPPYRWTFDARAIEETSAVSIDAACLRLKCDADHDLGYELFTRFAGLVRDRLQTARLQLLDLYGTDAT